MLQWINDRLKGIAFWVFILPLSVTFVFWGVQGVIDFSMSQGGGFQVNGEKVNAARVREAYQNQFAQLSRTFEGNVPEATRKQIQSSIIESFVQQQLVAQRAHQAGYRVSDAEVAESIRQLPYFQVGGVFNRDAYISMLQQQNLSVPAFEAEQREDLLTRQLVGGVGRSAFLTPREVDEMLALQGEQRELAYAVLPAAPYAAAATPTEAELEAWLTAHAVDYRTPESVALQFVELRNDAMAAKVAVTDEALLGYYESVKGRYATAEKRRPRHILIDAAAGDAPAKAKADALLAQLRQGADFAKLAQANSTDTGSAAQGGDLGLQEKDFFVGPFAAAVWSMKPGELQVVKTQFGYHVVQLEEIAAGTGKSFAELKAELAPEYQRNEADKIFGNLQDKLEESAFENTGALEPVARAVGLPVQTLDTFTRTAGGGSLPADKKLVDAVFAQSVLEGANSRAVDLGGGRVVVARVTQHRPPAAQPLAAVRERVLLAVRTAQGRERAAAAAAAAAKALDGGAVLSAALQGASGAQLTAAAWVGRKTTGVAPELLKAAFTGPRPGAARHGVVALANGDHALWVVTAGKPGSQLTGQEAAVAAQELIKLTTPRDFAGYLAALRAKAEVQLDDKLFD